MQTMEKVKDPTVSRIVTSLVNRKPLPRFSTAADARMALAIDEAWRKSIREKISEMARAARLARRDSWKQKQFPERSYGHLGCACTYIACARRLKGLL